MLVRAGQNGNLLSSQSSQSDERVMVAHLGVRLPPPLRPREVRRMLLSAAAVASAAAAAAMAALNDSLAPGAAVAGLRTRGLPDGVRGVPCLGLLAPSPSP